MGIQVSQLSVVIPGQVTRKYHADTDTTSIALDYEQAKEIHESTGKVLEFFGANTGLTAPVAADPDQLAIDVAPEAAPEPVGKAGRTAMDNPQA